MSHDRSNDDREVGQATENRGNKQYSDAEMLGMLQTCKRRHGECSPRVFNGDDDLCSATSVVRRFGSWSEAKEQAGISEDLSSNSGRNKEYSDEQILSHIRECANRHGTATTELLDQEDNLVASSVAVERFGTWSEAKKQAGLDPDARADNARPREYSDAEYLELLQECEQKYGRATQRTFDDADEYPSAGAIRKRFGSWADAKERAGLSVGKQREYSTEELLDMLRACKERHGKCTAHTFADDDDFCSPETVQRAFGSWSDAKQRALSESKQEVNENEPDRDIEDTR
jgi:transposase